MSRSHHAVPILAWLLAALPQAAAYAQAPAAAAVRIGTWNLEFLGAAGDFRNHLPVRDDDDYRKLGEKVRALGVAVLAVQEVCGEAPLRKVAAAAGPSWQLVLGTTGGFDDGQTAQNIGFLYDQDKVALLHAEELLAFPRTLENVPIFHRVPVTACFRVQATGFDFRAVTVHLKAGQKAQDEQKRRLEATTLHDWIVSLQQRPGEDQDIVVLGDFNSTYGTEPQRRLEQGGALQYLLQATPTPTILHFPEPIDQIARGPGLDEVQTRSFTVHGDLGGLDRDAWRKTYSDHFPVTVDLIAATDADPDAAFTRGDPQFALPTARRLPGAGTKADGPAAWPLRAGARVTVRYGAGHAPGGPIQASGRLLADVPLGPGGWLVLEREGRTVAIPFPQIVDVIAQ